MLTTLIFQGAILSLLALGTWLTFRVMDFPDLTVDGSYLMGASASAVALVSGCHPLASLLLGTLVGSLLGAITGLIHSKGSIHPLLAGIIVMIGSYSLALRLMGKANIALMNSPHLFSKGTGGYVLLMIVIAAFLAIKYLLMTRFGLMIRLLGDNPQLISSLNRPVGLYQMGGLMVANGLAGLSGGLMANYQGFADLGMGTGMVIVGLVSVILGESVIKMVKCLPPVLCGLFGAIAYRGVIVLALELGFAPGDLKALTAGLLLIIVWKRHPKTKLKQQKQPKQIQAKRRSAYDSGI